MAVIKDTLLLFDIDGTLVTSGGAGEEAIRLCLRERFGREDDLSAVELAGRTDASIAHQLFERHGIEATPENFRAFFDGYLDWLAVELPRRPGTLLPGVVRLLERLRLLPNVALALLTGNLSRGAELKLTHYGVWEFFDFGAFADDHPDRNQLGPFARRRALDRHGVEFAPERIFVLGDTPHDIDCGRAFGARTVAIGTGKFAREALAAHRPDFLFDDLSDVDFVITALGLQAGR